MSTLPIPAPHASPTPSAPWRVRLLRQGGNIAVVGTLLSLALWGYLSEWRLPKFSTLLGNAEPEAAAWCSTHGVPEEVCIECHVALLPPEKDHGWCQEHGVAACLLEHPEVAELKQPYAFSDADRKQAARALALVPRPANNSICKTHLRHVQFASQAAIDKAGVGIDVVAQAPVIEAITATGEVVYDGTRFAHLSSRVAGTVWRVLKQVGEPVRTGDVLALVDAAEVGRAKSEFMQALAHERLTRTNAERLTPLATQGAVPERQVREATAAQHEAQIRLMSARQTLVNLGLPVPQDQFGRLDLDEVAARVQFLGLPSEITAGWQAATTTSNLFPVRAALDGTVVERNVVEGEVIDSKQPLFSVADLSRMWLMLNVRQDDVELVRLGQPVRFRPSDRRQGSDITGQIAWISSSADERTRTVQVRVELPNADGALRANTFGTGRIVLREEASAVVVPSEAVHWDGCCFVAFVRDRHYFEPGALKFFHVRKVRPGVKQDGQTEIIVGLAPGEVIASKGSTVLASQLLKSNLGAGCGCAH